MKKEISGWKVVSFWVLGVFIAGSLAMATLAEGLAAQASSKPESMVFGIISIVIMFVILIFNITLTVRWFKQRNNTSFGNDAESLGVENKGTFRWSIVSLWLFIGVLFFIASIMLGLNRIPIPTMYLFLIIVFVPNIIYTVRWFLKK